MDRIDLVGSQQTRQLRRVGGDELDMAGPGGAGPGGGGMETVLRDLCDGAAGEWNVRVVAANIRRKTVRERSGEVDVVRAAAFGQPASVPLCPTIPLELWRRRADCVVLHEPNPIAGTALFVRTPAPRLVIWHHSDLVRPWWAPPTYGRIVQRALYRRADCVIVSSPPLNLSRAGSGGSGTSNEPSA